MRKKLLALLLAAALALSLLAGCGGGKALSQVIVDLLDNLYSNVSVEADSDLTAALKQAAAEGGTEEEILSRMIEILNHKGGSITFTRLGSGQQGEHGVTLYFQPGTDPDAAARNALAQWAGTLGTLPDDGSYQGDVAMIETENGYYIALDVEVLKAGKPDKPDKDDDEPETEPVDTSVIKLDSIDDLKNELAANPTATTVDFSGINGALTIPSNVLGSAASNIEKVIIPAGTTVDESAFSGLTDLTIEVTTPDTGTSTVNKFILGGASGVTLDLSKSGLTTIDKDAFNGCTGLTSVTFPESLTTIEIRAFYGCTGLTSVTFPEGLTTIESSAFQGCDKLTSVTFPKSLTTIKVTAFYNCDNLRQVTLPNRNGTLDIQNGAFSMDSSSQTQPLYLRIPKADITLNLRPDAFYKRVVTVYCDCDKDQEKIILEKLTAAGAKGPNGETTIEVKGYNEFPQQLTPNP